MSLIVSSFKRLFVPAWSAGWPFSIARGRPMSSLSGAGVSGPNAVRASALSQPHAGHLIRKIRLASSILELDDVLAASRKSLRSEHIGAASIKLGELTATPVLKQTSSLPQRHLNQRQKIAHELDALARHFALKMVSSHIGSVLVGLSRSQHQLTESSLHKLAARVIADGHQRLSVASDKDIKSIAQGFSRHRYHNPLLWDAIASELIKRGPNLEPSTQANILLDLPRDFTSHEGIRQLVKHLSSGLTLKIQELPPAKYVSILAWSSRLQPGLSEETRPLLRALLANTEGVVPRLTPQQVSFLASALTRLPDDLKHDDAKRILSEWLVKEKLMIDNKHSQHIQEVELALKAMQ